MKCIIWIAQWFKLVPTLDWYIENYTSVAKSLCYLAVETKHIRLQVEFAKELSLVVLLPGNHSIICFLFALHDQIRCIFGFYHLLCVSCQFSTQMHRNMFVFLVPIAFSWTGDLPTNRHIHTRINYVRWCLLFFLSLFIFFFSLACNVQVFIVCNTQCNGCRSTSMEIAVSFWPISKWEHVKTVALHPWKLLL